MTAVYVLHKNYPYEFGVVIGAFTSMEVAVEFALTLDEEERCEYSVIRCEPQDKPVSLELTTVWQSFPDVEPKR